MRSSRVRSALPSRPDSSMVSTECALVPTQGVTPCVSSREVDSGDGSPPSSSRERPQDGRRGFRGGAGGVAVPPMRIAPLGASSSASPGSGPGPAALSGGCAPRPPGRRTDPSPAQSAGLEGGCCRRSFRRVQRCHRWSRARQTTRLFTPAAGAAPSEPLDLRGTAASGPRVATGSSIRHGRGRPHGVQPVIPNAIRPCKGGWTARPCVSPARHTLVFLRVLRVWYPGLVPPAVPSRAFEADCFQCNKRQGDADWAARDGSVGDPSGSTGTRRGSRDGTPGTWTAARSRTGGAARRRTASSGRTRGERRRPHTSPRRLRHRGRGEQAR